MPVPSGYLFPDLNGYVRHSNAKAFTARYPVAACKVSEGAHFGSAGAPGTPNYWPTFLTMCRAGGTFPIGYHFLRRGVPIGDQVSNFLGRLEWRGIGSCGIMLDIETAHDKTNPTFAEATAWFTLVSSRIGLPRAAMSSYVNREWYRTYGGGSTALRDTIWWMPQYSSRPNLAPMAGWAAPVIWQFSSTTPGAGMPPGDMNVALGMTAAQLKTAFTGKPTSPPPEDDMPDEKYFNDKFDELEDRVWDVRYTREGDVGHDVNLENVDNRLKNVEGKVDEILALLQAKNED